MFPWLEIMRLSNAPTIASNVLTGLAIGLLARLSGQSTPWLTALTLLGGTLLIYTAGMVLNDAYDARVDALERPSRPIPSGRISKRSAGVVGLLMLAAGTALLAFSGEQTFPWALLLGASVLLYDTLHRQVPGSWLLLALCRALVVVISAKATSPGAEWPIMGWIAGSLFVYVACFSIAARDEVRGLSEFSRGAAALLPVLTLAPAGVLMFDIPRENGVATALAAGVLLLIAVPANVLAGREARRGRAGIPLAVGGWIGTISLMDAAVCLMLGRPWMGLACVGLWGVAGAMRPRIAAS